MADQIRIAIVGVGNCASSLVQGINYYKQAGADESLGLMHPDMCGYRVADIVPVVAFDVDARKVGRDLAEAIFAPPNMAYVYPDVQVLSTGVQVLMGPVMDGVPEHLQAFVEIAEDEPVDVAQALADEKVDVVLNLLPTGSSAAARHYAECALEAGPGFVNGMPELIVCNTEYAKKAQALGIPVIGDDVKSQLGATILHRVLLELLMDRGIRIKKSYQLNFAGNTDFCNLVRRGESKKLTKIGALTGMLPYEAEISVGVSYVELMKDRKTAKFYIEASNFGDAPLRFEASLEVEDSPNFAGVIVDAARCCKIAKDRGVGGVLYSACAYLMKHPPQTMLDHEAREQLEEFLAGTRER